MCGANGNRTSDTRIFSPLLYQLSYGTQFLMLSFVRRMRLELTQPNGHYPLKVACLPISPPRLKSWKNGAKNGTRTRDPDLGKVVLYQLSYFRIRFIFRTLWPFRFLRCKVNAKFLFQPKKLSKNSHIWQNPYPHALIYFYVLITFLFLVNRC